MLQPDISNRQAEKIVNISRTTVGKIRKLLSTIEINEADIISITDNDLSEKLGLQNRPKRKTKKLPDFSHVEKELSKPNVTLNLLWQEYKEIEPDGISYTHYARLYKSWKKNSKISMKQVHLAGDKLYVDFCGQTVPILLPDGSVDFNAKIFVGVMGASQFIVSYAVRSEQKKDWQLCHIKAFEQLGGVPNFVVPDNLKSGVTKHTKDHVEVNTSYMALAEYYSCFILPSRPRRPQDKSLAEIGVKYIQTQVLAVYRNFKFYSLAELNEKLAIGTEKLNAAFSKALNGTRIERFNDFDAKALKPLPDQAYPLDDWEYQKLVKPHYHLSVEDNEYSVPFQYVSQLVDIQVTTNHVHIYCGKELIASHNKCEQKNQTITNAAHRPANHAFQAGMEPNRLLAWGKKIGEHTHEVVRKNICERKDVSNGFICVKYLKKWLQENDDRELLERACAHAIKINSCTKQTLTSILTNQVVLHRTDSDQLTKSTKSHKNIRGSEYYRNKNDDN